MERKQADHFLTLIVPAYKQEKTILRNIKQILYVLDTIRYDYEVIVVVDGTVDRSFDILRKARLPKTICMAYGQNQGKSYAIRLGMNEAKGDYIMFLDSGMEIDPNGISMLLEHMQWYDADIIVGSKRHPASIVNYSNVRKLLSLGYYYIVKLLFGLKIRDTQAGIKVFKKKVLVKILPRLVEKKFAGDLEILVSANILGFKRIYEAPIRLDYHVSPLTSAATLQSIFGIIVDTMAIYYRAYIKKHYNQPGISFSYPKDLKIIKSS